MSAWQWIDSQVWLLGGIGGLVATEIKRREARLLPPTAQAHPSTLEYVSDYLWNTFLGVLLVHLYSATGSVLNILTATITGGSAALIFKSLLAAAPHQLPGKTEPPQG